MDPNRYFAPREDEEPRASVAEEQGVPVFLPFDKLKQATLSTAAASCVCIVNASAGF